MAKKVLIIDDEPGIRTMLQFELSEKGLEVSVASNGEEGLERFKAARPDLVITDMRMPGMDGVETSKAIHKIAPDMPVVLMTGFVEAMDFDKTLRGIKSQLQKPFSLDELLWVLQEYFPGLA